MHSNVQGLQTLAYSLSTPHGVEHAITEAILYIRAMMYIQAQGRRNLQISLSGHRFRGLAGFATLVGWTLRPKFSLGRELHNIAISNHAMHTDVERLDLSRKVGDD